MARKNIFQLVEENYDVKSEIEKINSLFQDEAYFSTGYIYWSLYELVEEHLFQNWKYRQTCLDLDEFLEKAETAITIKESFIKEEHIINNLEVMENFIKLYFDSGDELYNRQGIRYTSAFETVFIFLIKTLEKRMGLIAREYKDRVIIYPKNAPLEKVVDLCEDEDVQWELIRYVREELSLSEKRKTLAYLATNLNIEDDKNEKDEHIKALVKKAGNVLNNLHIRHNNKTGKWESEVFKGLTQKEAISLCDMVYNEMLTIVLLREHKEYDDIYEEFNKKQKELSAKKKVTE
ncbi:MAG: hypothetical protein IJZ88_08190 [Clostridia bacterium]|nr:hypothetical protein [Clostridia bacterium]